MSQDVGAPAQWAEDPFGRHRYRFWDGTAWTQLVADGVLPPLDPVPAADGPAAAAAPPATPGGGPPSGSKDPPATGPSTGPTPATGLTPEPAFWTIPAPGPQAGPDAPPAPALPTVRVLVPDDRVHGPSDGTPLRTHAALTVATLGLWLLALPGLQLWRRHRREWAVLWAIGSTVLVALAGVLTVGHLGGDGPAGRTAVVVPGADVAAPAPAPTTSSSRTAGPVPAGSRTATTRPGRTTRPPRSTRPTRTTRPVRTSRTPRTTAVRPTPTTDRTTSATTTRAATPAGPDPRFLTCIQARANGYGPYRRGVDPEYSWYWDVDGNGVVCE